MQKQNEPEPAEEIFRFM